MNFLFSKTVAYGIAAVACVIIVCVLLGGDGSTECKNSKYTFINKHQACLDTDQAYAEMKTKEDSIRRYIDGAIATKKISRASMYFRDLETLKWFGVNKDYVYSPGSLLKLPVAIAYYKLAEIDPGILSQTIVYATSTLNELGHFRPQKSLSLLTSYILCKSLSRQ